ncbi:Hpt domain-containing protein [Arthrobacter sp. ISL-65]|uniref:Hpt domain-containing protein n=1 Tax=Arthrobacter sp. ISL-65 TaxID=2819112 RepID=UPI001BE6DC9B|nr:Hpt domain-containing protein [Arthrobacter sp. ISL-65]MBT2549166.1 Hpt domain-containing protein [Arthrobacter sp. ISL-65]
MSISGSGTAESNANGVCLPAPASHDGMLYNESERATLPVLNLDVLHDLEEDMGSTGVAHNFARDYIRIWDKRRSYLEASVENDDADAAMDAVLSLKNSALMVGAARLAKLAVDLEQLVKHGDLQAARQMLPCVALTGQQTVSGLRLGYLPPEV